MRETYTVHTDHYPAILSRDGEARSDGLHEIVESTNGARATWRALALVALFFTLCLWSL